MSIPGHLLRPLAAALALAAAASRAQQATPPADAAAKPPPTQLAPVAVNAEAWRETLKAKLQHLLPEVDGTKITVTKKTTVTHLADQPTVIGNNLDQLLARSPGVQVSQQPTPTQFNLSYRGLGNPQESEYVLVMQDGIPLESDWIGFPTLYAMPLTQSLSEVQLIRGGSSLLYGPEPAPVINLVSRRPAANAPFALSSEQVVGNHGLYSTYNAVEGSSGRWSYRADAAYVGSDGTRANAGSQMRQADLYVGYRPDDRQLWWIDLHAIDAASGDAGRLGYPQWQANPRATPTPYNRDWVDRDQIVLGQRSTFGDGWLFEGKAWFAYQDLASRAAANAVAGQAPPTGTTLQDAQFRTSGADLRLRRKWGRGNAFTVGTTLFHGDDPLRQWSSSDLYVDRHDRRGTPRLRQARTSNYAAVFAENVFRLPHRFHIVPSLRLEHERVAVAETVRPPFLSRPLIDQADTRTVPLLGLGIGNDFGHGNESYFNISQGWRPLRYFDMASPFANILPGQAPDPSKSLSYELGAHGVPVAGLYYDVSLFWIDFRNQIEAVQLNNIDVVEVNTGDTRSRGLEGQLNYDFLARSGAANSGEHLEAFVNASLLDARYVASAIPGQVGKIPAYAPRYLLKAGLTWRVENRVKLSLTAVSSAAQFWQASDQSHGSGGSYLPARIPAYTVLDLAGDWQLDRHLTLLAGVSNLADRAYYDRVWQNGLEPALGRAWYAGVRWAM
ncbi:MAG: TonB-dependent receptor [Xanthomonadaceae bacterium]|nr:TonB-dependent receptor [Xanthomonadaceae bacterium]